MSESTFPEEPDLEEVPKISRLGQIVRLSKKIWQLAARNRLLTAVLAAGTLVIAASGTMALKSILYPDVKLDHAAILTAALTRLDAGQFGDAKQLAIKLLDSPTLSYEHHGGALFVLGTALAHEADETLSVQERAKLHLVAARLLGIAETEGFPKGRRGEGLYLHGRSLYLSGNLAESIPVLLSALDASSERADDIHRLLASAYFLDSEPQLKKALRHNRLALANETISAEQRDQYWLQQAQILLAMDRFEECEKLLQGLAARPAEQRGPIMIVLGQLRMRQGELASSAQQASETQEQRDGSEKYREAIAIFRESQKADQTGEVSRQALYLIGICHRRMGELAAAEEAFVRTRRQHYRTEEAFAALLAEAEIQLSDERFEPAVASLLELIADIGDPASYANRWVSWYELTDRLDVAWRRLLSEKRFQDAITLTTAMKQILPDDHAVAASAMVRETWGEELSRQADSETLSTANVTRMRAREQFRLAGVKFSQLAKLRFVTPQYPTDLWQGGFNYLRGHNYEMAAQLLRQFLKHCDRRSQPRGLLALGNAQLALGNYDQALKAFQKCIGQHGRHPATYRARLGAAQVLQEMASISQDPKLIDQAKKMLADNLHHEALTPRSVQWRESLIAIGTLLYDQAKAAESRSRQGGIDRRAGVERSEAITHLKRSDDLFRESLHYLEEVVRRYPDSKPAIKARYMIAQAYRHMALGSRKTISFEPTQTGRHAIAREMRGELQTAAERFLSLQRKLEQTQAERELTEIEKLLLRNACFAYGDVLFDLGEYDAASRAYSDASNRYQHQPEALEAFVQMASCYRRSDLDAEARGTLQQAKTLLKRIPPDTDFTQTTRYSREEWIEFLGWLAQL